MVKPSHAWSVYRSSDEDHLEMVRPVLSFFNVVDVKGDYLFPRHQHFNYQLICTKRSVYRCQVNDDRLTLKAGDILIVKPGDWHEDYGSKGLVYYALNFELAGGGGERGIDIVFQPGIAPHEQVLRGGNAECWNIIDRMQTEATRSDPFVAHLENALLLELFWRLIRALPRPRLSSVLLHRSQQQAFSQRLRRLFDNHLDRPLDAVTIAMQLGVSVRTLSTRCREITKKPPMQAFMAHKMNHAALLLQITTLSVKAISYRLGFQNQYHFSRVFRRFLGKPPTTFRALPK